MSYINIQLPDDLHSELKFLALRHGCSLKALIIQILLEYLKKGEGK